MGRNSPTYSLPGATYDGRFPFLPSFVGSSAYPFGPPLQWVFWNAISRLVGASAPRCLLFPGRALFLPLLDGLHFFLQPFFQALVGGAIILTVLEIVRQALHIGELFFGLVSILISLAITEIGHQSGHRIAQMHRDGLRQGLLRVASDFAIANIKRIG